MNNDLISREVLKGIWELYKLYQPRLATNVYKFGEALKDIIDNAPTAEAVPLEFHEKVLDNATKELFECQAELERVRTEKRPQGEWIIVDDTEQFIAKCSVCGRIEDSRMVKDYPFCHCGAKMKGGAE